MFNFKFSFLNIGRTRHRQTLPMDFGTMYFLYPSENEHCVGFGTTGLLDKATDKIRDILERKNKDMEYFKTESFF